MIGSGYMGSMYVIESAIQMVRSKLEDMEYYGMPMISLTKEEMLSLSAALLVASVLCKNND